MGKIKNWRRVKEDEVGYEFHAYENEKVEYMWENEKTGNILMVINYMDEKFPYSVELQSQPNKKPVHPKNLSDGNASRKELARRFAVNWMKENPMGRFEDIPETGDEITKYVRD